jgi:hypothetical protein
VEGLEDRRVLAAPALLFGVQPALLVEVLGPAAPALVQPANPESSGGGSEAISQHPDQPGQLGVGSAHGSSARGDQLSIQADSLTTTETLTAVTTAVESSQPAADLKGDKGELKQIALDSAPLDTPTVVALDQDRGRDELQTGPVQAAAGTPVAAASLGSNEVVLQQVATSSVTALGKTNGTAAPKPNSDPRALDQALQEEALLETGTGFAALRYGEPDGTPEFLLTRSSRRVTEDPVLLLDDVGGMKKREVPTPHAYPAEPPLPIDLPARTIPETTDSFPKGVAVGGVLPEEDGGATVTLNLDQPGRLATFNPERPAALDVSLAQFLNQLEDLARGLSRALTSPGVGPWLMALASVGASFAVVRTHRRRRQFRLGLAAVRQDATLTWAGGLPGPFSSEES